jgi:hypothetical protein
MTTTTTPTSSLTFGTNATLVHSLLVASPSGRS